MKKALTLFAFVIALCGFTSPVFGIEWLHNIEKAQEKAKENNKAILVDFTGSDWCGWCIRLKKEVFNKPTFQEKAPEKFVFVKLDFPRKKQLDPAQKKYNRKMQKKFSVRGFPTILLLDKEGRPFGKTGYKKGGPEKYLEHLDELLEVRNKRDQLLEEAEKASGVDKAKKLDEVLSYLKKKNVARFYTGLMKKIVELDENNKAGLKEKYEATIKNMEIESTDLPAVLGKYLRTRNPSQEQLNKAAEALAKILAKGPSGETAQKVHYYAAIVQYRLKNKDKAIKMLEKAKQAAPNSRLAGRISRIIQKLSQ